MKITFEELNYTDFEITDIVAMNQKWAENYSFSMNHPRPTDGLLFFDGCDAVLSHKNSENIYVKKGSLCHIPKGDMYTWTFCNNTGSDVWCMLFEFVLIDKKGQLLELSEKTHIIDSIHTGLYKRLFSQLVAEFTKPKSSFPKIKAAAYSVLSAVSDAVGEKNVSEKSYGCILDGIKYLEEDRRQEKSISEIAEMCGVSVNYFERLFKEYSGMTPALYRLTRKTDRAKMMLRTPVLTVEQIAYELGYIDCAYFCRSFKKMCGMTPTEYRKMYFGRNNI